jgi:1,2-diacylglycerol 3-beta-glucosyltransferase
MPAELFPGLMAVVFAPLALAVAAVGSYLTLLSAAAFIAAPARPHAGPGRRRFAVLIPAHDEAPVIERALNSLRAQSYTRQNFDVFVVADNCTDTTAEIARRGGAIVHERSDSTLRAKGHALRWLLERVRDRGRYDAYVVLDADSVITPEFLKHMDARLETGSKAIQAHYRVLNPSASSISALREAAFASLHYVRPLGRAALGLSCGLKGNGMCFDANALDQHGWSSAGLAEDVELHLALIRAGVRVDFAPEAIVRAEMPTSLRDAQSQNMRWEAGRLSVLRRDVPGLLKSGIALRNAMVIDAAVEQLIPPLSVAFLCGAASTLVSAASGGSALVLGLSLFGTAAIGAHVVTGLIAVRAPARTFLALISAPPYIAWKTVLYARALVAPAGLAWVRTRRGPAGGPPS